MPGIEETRPHDDGGRASIPLVGGHSDPTEFRDPGQSLATRRLWVEPDGDGLKYQYRVRWRRNGWTRDKARRYDRWYYVPRFIRKLTGDPTWGHRARPLSYIAVDRREIIPDWETIEEWDEWEL